MNEQQGHRNNTYFSINEVVGVDTGVYLAFSVGFGLDRESSKNGHQKEVNGILTFSAAS